jgi:Protein of unknown function (DUF2911)
MTKKLMFGFACAAFIAVLGFAQDKDEKKGPPPMERKTAEATWPEGKLTLNYGSPVWKDEFKAEAAKAGFVWRFGNNAPTAATLTSGLESAQGAIPPGEYTVAIRSGGDNKWDLLFYEPKAFYDAGFKTWEIKAAGPVSELKAPAKNFTLKFEGKKLIAEFGPMSSTWELKPIKVNPPVETEFGQVATKFEVLALPASTPLKDTTIGVATATQDGVAARYHMKFTAEGDKATLNFVNERAQTLPKEKEAVETLLGRIGKMLEEHPERKEMADPIVVGLKSQVETLDAMLKRYERMKPTATVDGTVTKRDTPATELGVSHDRPMKAITLKLALANSDAAFEVKPREQFLKPREKKPE